MIIGIDRPGMGSSDFIKFDNLIEYSTYVTELADILSIEKFGLIGTSGGGAYALTMAMLCLREFSLLPMCVGTHIQNGVKQVSGIT